MNIKSTSHTDDRKSNINTAKFLFIAQWLKPISAITSIIVENLEICMAKGTLYHPWLTRRELNKFLRKAIDTYMDTLTLYAEMLATISTRENISSSTVDITKHHVMELLFNFEKFLMAATYPVNIASFSGIPSSYIPRHLKEMNTNVTLGFKCIRNITKQLSEIPNDKEELEESLVSNLFDFSEGI